MSDWFLILLILYFVLLIINLVLGRLFLSELKRSRSDLWTAWERPASVFSPKKSNIDLYRFIFLARKVEFKELHRLYRISKALALASVLTHLSFIAAVVSFLAG